MHYIVDMLALTSLLLDHELTKSILTDLIMDSCYPDYPDWVSKPDPLSKTAVWILWDHLATGASAFIHLKRVGVKVSTVSRPLEFSLNLI